MYRTKLNQIWIFKIIPSDRVIYTIVGFETHLYIVYKTIVQHLWIF